MKLIAKTLDIRATVAAYAARQSFAAMIKGTFMEFIPEVLRHHDVRTSEHYLDSFENETKKYFTQSLSA